jgi:hypothetical protein
MQNDKNYTYVIMLKSDATPYCANRNAKIATIGEISIIPNGGIILRKGSK